MLLNAGLVQRQYATLLPKQFDPSADGEILFRDPVNNELGAGIV